MNDKYDKILKELKIPRFFWGYFKKKILNSRKPFREILEDIILENFLWEITILFLSFVSIAISISKIFNF
ncbi:MAG: hypothetical protein ACPL1F_01000 [bacterium]